MVVVEVRRTAVAWGQMAHLENVGRTAVAWEQLMVVEEIGRAAVAWDMLALEAAGRSAVG